MQYGPRLVPHEAPRLERPRLLRNDRDVPDRAVVRNAGAAVTPRIPTDADIAAVVFPPITPPDPLAELEAAEGICAQESDE